MEMEGDLGRCTQKQLYIDDVIDCILETCIILLTNITPNKVNKNLKINNKGGQQGAEART